MKENRLAALLFLSISTISFAQRIRKVEGNPAEIGEAVKMNTLFTYDNLSAGKFEKEEDYIASKKANYNKKNHETNSRYRHCC
jgi:hypothetical protein